MLVALDKHVPGWQGLFFPPANKCAQTCSCKARSTPPSESSASNVRARQHGMLVRPFRRHPRRQKGINKKGSTPSMTLWGAHLRFVRARDAGCSSVKAPPPLNPPYPFAPQSPVRKGANFEQVFIEAFVSPLIRGFIPFPVTAGSLVNYRMPMHSSLITCSKVVPRDSGTGRRTGKGAAPHVPNPMPVLTGRLEQSVRHSPRGLLRHVPIRRPGVSPFDVYVASQCPVDQGII